MTIVIPFNISFDFLGPCKLFYHEDFRCETVSGLIGKMSSCVTTLAWTLYACTLSYCRNSTEPELQKSEQNIKARILTLLDLGAPRIIQTQLKKYQILNLSLKLPYAKDKLELASNRKKVKDEIQSHTNCRVYWPLVSLSAIVCLGLIFQGIELETESE